MVKSTSFSQPLKLLSEYLIIWAYMTVLGLLNLEREVIFSFGGSFFLFFPSVELESGLS